MIINEGNENAFKLEHLVSKQVPRVEPMPEFLLLLQLMQVFSSVQLVVGSRSNPTAHYIVCLNLNCLCSSKPDEGV
jgi:hypothetical protein